METINGIGTTCYGKANPIGNTFIATEWLVFLYFPVWPIRSRRMRVVNTSWRFLGTSTQYQIYEQISFADNLGQIARTWAWTLVPLGLFAVAGSVPPGARILLAGYVIAALGLLGFAGTRVGRKALSEGWQSVAGLTLLTFVLYGWSTGGGGTWRVTLAPGVPYNPELPIIAGILLFIALVWCGGIRRMAALGGALLLAALTSAIDIVFTLAHSSLPNDPTSRLAVQAVADGLWGGALLLAAGAIAADLRRGSYWLIQLGLPALGGLATSLVAPMLVSVLRNSGVVTLWAIWLVPFVLLTKAIPLGCLGTWLQRGRWSYRR